MSTATASASKKRHALVTGGGTGIGIAIAKALVEQGMNVSVVGRRLDVLQSLANTNPEHIFATQADVSNQAQVQQAFAKAKAHFGNVEILINNAGQAISAPFLKTDMALWQQMLNVNLTGSMLTMQAALPDMQQAGWGRIINIASTAGQVGYAYVAAYSAAKHGVIGLTKSVALETAKKGITVNAVCPGYTETEIVRESIARIVEKTGRTIEQAKAQLTAANPQGRLIQTNEVANAVVWLCSEGASAISGQSISVCGGEVM